METSITLANHTLTMLESLIQGMNNISITEVGSISNGNIPLIINTTEFSLTPIEEEPYDEGSDIYTYVETITNSHDYELLSLHSCSTYTLL